MHRSVKELRDLCGLILPKNPYRFKASIADRYETLYRRLQSDLLNGPILHIDETTVKLRARHGYVWVMANMETVFFEYRSSRKGAFLTQRLSSFGGVLVSDFFTAYDAFDCPQQKCVLHLIRDINDAMRRYPYDAELQRLALGFATIFQSIIATVDRYGLKRRHLNKHKRETERFFRDFCGTPSSSELLRNYGSDSRNMATASSHSWSSTEFHGTTIMLNTPSICLPNTEGLRTARSRSSRSEHTCYF